MIFAREISAPLTSLVKKIDAATQANTGKKMGSFVVFCSDEEGLEGKLKELSKAQDLKQIVLTMDSKSGPPKYKVAADADVTVVLYNKKKVASNFTFKKGEFKDADVDKILADLPKILP